MYYADSDPVGGIIRSWPILALNLGVTVAVPGMIQIRCR